MGITKLPIPNNLKIKKWLTEAPTFPKMFSTSMSLSYKLLILLWSAFQLNIYEINETRRTIEMNRNV